MPTAGHGSVRQVAHIGKEALLGKGLLRPSPEGEASAAGAAHAAAGSIAVCSFVRAGSRSRLMSRYLRSPHLVPATWRNRAATSISALCPSGKAPTTRVRRRVTLARVAHRTAPFLGPRLRSNPNPDPSGVRVFW